MEISQKEALVNVLNQFSEIEKNNAESNRFSYIFSKAWLFIKLGPDKYRKNDAFNQPPSDFDDEILEILMKGCRQVLKGFGMSKEKPFTELDVLGFSGLFKMFHFHEIKRQCKHGFILNGNKGALDCITFQHLMDGSQIVYFNFCQYPSLID